MDSDEKRGEPGAGPPALALHLSPDDPRAVTLARAILALCDPDAPPSAPDHDLDVLTRLAVRHGLQGRLAGLEVEPSCPVSAVWRRRRLVQAARAELMLQQLQELAEAFHAAGIRVMALKGAAALAWLYSEPADRETEDLDLLVEAEVVPAVRALLERLGYTAQAVHTSAEDAQLALDQGHLPPYARSGRFPVEIHVNILKQRAGQAPVRGALWGEAVPETFGGVPLLRPCWEHFMLHTLAHYMDDRAWDLPSLKSCADLIRLVRHHGAAIDWSRFWAAAGEWGVHDEAATVMATLAHRWELSIPGLPRGAVPLGAHELVFGRGEHPSGYAGFCLRRIAAARALPGWGARCRYLFHLLFPAPSTLRRRYRVPEGAPLLPYYARHPFRLGRRVLRSLRARR